MIYLLLAIICSSAIALVFRYSEQKGLNRYAVTSVNYLVASILSAAVISLSSRHFGGKLSLATLLSDLSVMESNGRLSADSSLTWALIVGGFAGIVFFLAFVLYQISVKREGVGLSGAFAKLGILLPMVLSLLLWREFPGGLKWLGIGLATGSILLVNWPTVDRRSIRPSLLLLFFFGGLAEFSNKIFQKYALTDFSPVFLLVTFGTALIWSSIVTAVRRKPITGRDVLTGVAVGIPNLFSSYFLIRALDSVPAAVAFPIFGAGTILVLAAVGGFAFGERLTGREKIAVGLVAAAMILINL